MKSFNIAGASAGFKGLADAVRDDQKGCKLVQNNVKAVSQDIKLEWSRGLGCS